MSKKYIDYRFGKGQLEAQITSFDAKGNTTTHADSEPIVDIPSAKRRKELTRELAATTRTIEHPDGAVQVGFLNTDVPPEDGITVYNMGIGGNFEHPVGLFENVAFAAANPDRRIMVVNNAGSGESSLVPKPVIDRMKAAGSFAPQGEWMLRVLQRELGNYGDITLNGNSAGARAAIGIAAAMTTVKLGNPLSELTVFDPVGAKDRITLGVDWAFLRQQPEAMRYAKRSPYNPAKLNLLEQKPANLFTAKGAFAQNMWNLPGAMKSRTGFIYDLVAALDAVKEGGEVAVIQPEFSQFARPDQMKKAMAEAAVYSSMYSHPAIFRHIQIDNHSHPLLAEGTGPNALVTAYKIAE